MSILAISYGSEEIFNSAATAVVNIAKLDSTHFVIVYTDFGNSGYLTAIIAEISSMSISYGSANVVSNTAYQYAVGVAALDSTHFVVAYKDTTNSNYGTARIGLTSGTTISSYGAENVFNSGTTDSIDIATLDSTHFVVSYRDTSNSEYGTAIVGVVTGTTISSYGSENVFNTATTTITAIDVLDSTHFVVAYQDTGGSSYGCAVIGLVSGTTISSYGSENIFNTASTDLIDVTVLDPNNFIASYQDVGNSYYGTAISGTVSGTTISEYGDESVFNSAYTNNIKSLSIDSTHFIVAYKDEGNSNYGTAVIGDISKIGDVVVTTPPERTMEISVENRTLTIQAENRTMEIPFENRTLTIN